ncbi:MAG TPA: hypothetical protein VF797_15145 [Noviherbaspirillum sp.]
MGGNDFQGIGGSDCRLKAVYQECSIIHEIPYWQADRCAKKNRLSLSLKRLAVNRTIAQKA